MSAQEAVAYARSLVGKAKWRHQGRQPWAVDCIGLVTLSLVAAGHSAPAVPARYGREPWGDMLRRGLRDNFGGPVSDWQPGDVPLIQWNKGEPTHVGLLADYVWGGLSIIHADNLRGVIETRLAEQVHDCVIEVYRPRWGA